jgi:hypothetical protein
MTDDGDISRRYRELPREEPPRHLDEAILAAARRAANTRPAPLVVPSGRQRWYFPLAAAAVIVLAVAVTVHVERERPAEEVLSSAPASAPSAPAMAREQAPPEAQKPAPPEAKRPAQQQQQQPERRRKAEADSRQLRDQPAAAAPPPELQKAPEPSAPPAAPAQDAAGSRGSAGALLGRIETQTSAPGPAAAPQAAPSPPSSSERAKAIIASKPRPDGERRFQEGGRSATVLSASAVRSPEQWLQGIADLRRQSRHEEADREIAEFRKSYPSYKIPEAVLRR